jgi:hypothetical protein
MDGFKNSTKTQYTSSPEGDDVLAARMTAREMAQGRAGVDAARARLAGQRADPSGSVRASDAQRAAPKKAVPVAPKRPLVEPRSEYGPAKSLRIPLKKGGQPVQKKSLGGIMKAMSPAYALASGEPEKLLGGMTTMGLISQLMKKKQSGQTLTPAENQQVAQASSGSVAAKKGGMIKKGVPVAPKGPMVGLAAMPKKK